jgi:uncharacterized membrane protein
MDVAVSLIELFHSPILILKPRTKIVTRSGLYGIMRLMNHTLTPPVTFADKFSRWLDRRLLWLSANWFVAVNAFFGILAGLPVLAPILMHYGFTGPANRIYQAYRLTCHQFPSRSYFIFEHQVAVCHRDLAIWTTIFVGGTLFGLVRHRLKQGLPFHWWLLFVIPIGLDGGTQLVGDFYEVMPWFIPTGFAFGVAIILTLILWRRKALRWQYLLFVWLFPAAMLWVQFTGSRLSNAGLRTITGMTFGLGNVLLAYPLLAEEFEAVHYNLQHKLNPPDDSAEIA